MLIEHYFKRNTVIQAGYPLDMRYAGPREALLHALFRQNYGCSHLIVGRDHAGVADYYGPYDAQRAFDELPLGALQIAPLKIDWTFWCQRCGGMASERTCPHDQNDRLLLSGTRLREALYDGAEVPPELSRPEVLQVLRKYYSLEAAAGEEQPKEPAMNKMTDLSKALPPLNEADLRARLGAVRRARRALRAEQGAAFHRQRDLQRRSPGGGSWSEIVLDYEVGASGIADGAWFKATFKFYSDWALFQTVDPSAANYVSRRIPGRAAARRPEPGDRAVAEGALRPEGP